MGCKVSHQLELFKVGMVVVCESMMPVDEARSFVILGPGKGASTAFEVGGSRYEGDFCFVRSKGSYTRGFLGKGQGFRDTF